MKIETNRFGTIEAQSDDLVHFPRGLIGFPADRQFILIPHPKSEVIAWLQSATTPDLAFPVVSAHGLPADYPDVSIAEVAEKQNVTNNLEDLAILVVLSAAPGLPATVNLLAPLLVNASERRGVQVFLEGSRFTTRELFVLPEPKSEPEKVESEKSEPKVQAAASVQP